MRFYEVEDRAVVSFDPNNAIVFDAGLWRKPSISFARKTLLDGSELTEEQFWRMFPVAAAQLPAAPDSIS